ncbi:alkaline phosphatase [Streptomyces ruber]|uniref:Alkaline phosphatase n=2 Tax=Streptomyces TaxID=1883 RepID=A0A918BAA5_9ACTN|nr:alkaline phosphatase D family protein [Streptomyces ruber]GGQ52451.1 alkaline phosphatase [Streptomyces ruber]
MTPPPSGRNGLSGPGRRAMLRMSGVTAGALLAGAGLAGASAEAAGPAVRLPDDPFRLGVASGEPAEDGFVLWTRLVPDPTALDGHGGMPPTAYDVEWEVAEDEGFRRVVRRGRAVAVPELAHSVHPRVTGLRPGRQYFYRFRAAGRLSPAGRVRTAPSARSGGGAFTFATASCQAWYHGHFSAYRGMAADDPDVVLFLGDYIYEYAITARNLWRRGVTLGEGHDAETNSLARYRVRYGLTKSDPDLRAAHAAAAWVLTPDDHEVQNDYADETSYYGLDPAAFRRRRAAAYRAYYENTPLPPAALAHGPDARFHRRLPYGPLADVHVLDGRQHRDGRPADAAEQADPARSLLGADQERWLYSGLRRSRARWNLLAQQVAVMRVTDSRTDQWDGFPAARQRLLDVLAEPGTSPTVVLTGDTHRAVAGDLLADFSRPDSAVVASELVGTSIASDGDGSATDGYAADWLQHPWTKFYDGHRGYVLGRVTGTELTADYRAVPYVEADADAPVTTVARFTVEADRPGLREAG